MVLTDEQIKSNYFDVSPGFPAINSDDISTYANFFQELKEYTKYIQRTTF